MDSEFTNHVAELARKRTHLDIQVRQPGELIVNGRSLHLEAVYRLSRQDPDHADAVIERYVDQVFPVDRSAIEAVDRGTLDEVRDRILPRVQGNELFARLNRDLVAHQPFVNGTSIVYVLDTPQMSISLMTTHLARWKVTVENLDAIARENLDRYAPEMELTIAESPTGGVAAVLSRMDGYDAARLLLPDLWERLSPKLGSEFLAAIPARDVFIAMSQGPKGFVEKLRGKAVVDHAKLPYPITTRLFTVTRDGIAGDGWPDPG